MDLFKQALAPIPREAWKEINGRAEAVIKSVLSARKALRVIGPLGLENTAVSTGRMHLLKNETDQSVKSGLYENLSLMESRVDFELNRWELDNILRGTRDVDFDQLDQAALKLAEFEEKTIFYGHKEAKIPGLLAEAAQTIDLGSESQAIVEGIAQAVIKLEGGFAKKPFVLLVSPKLMMALNKIHGAKILREIIENIIGGKVILAKGLDGALLMPSDHEDLELRIGQDYTIGYQDHDSQSVHLFIMISFLPRVIDKNLLIRLKY